MGAIFNPLQLKIIYHGVNADILILRGSADVNEQIYLQ